MYTRSVKYSADGGGMKYKLHILLRYVNTYYVTSSMNVGIIHGLECRKCKLCIIVLYIIKYKDIDYR